jgi:predicted amidohydrolase YtcJ
VLAWEKTYYGQTLPTGITEWNFDPGTGTLGAFAGDNNFMFQWTEAMLQTIENDHMAFANEFTTLNYSGFGALDMFSDSSPYAPKAQFYAMVDMGKKAGTGSTMTIPAF